MGLPMKNFRPYFIESEPQTINSDYSFTVSRFKETNHTDKRWVLALRHSKTPEARLCFGYENPLYESELSHEEIISQMVTWLNNTLFSNESIMPQQTNEEMTRLIEQAFGKVKKYDNSVKPIQHTEDDEWVAAMMDSGIPDRDGDVYLADGMYINAKGEIFEK